MISTPHNCPVARECSRSARGGSAVISESVRSVAIRQLLHDLQEAAKRFAPYWHSVEQLAFVVDVRSRHEIYVALLAKEARLQMVHLEKSIPSAHDLATRSNFGRIALQETQRGEKNLSTTPRSASAARSRACCSCAMLLNFPTAPPPDSSSSAGTPSCAGVGGSLKLRLGSLP
eukprot:CAMPEP_0119364946 /NCGR_PEP_ID=MMETSP1334-20130426/11869_1 /TAXON_ID=127549 /ORGANISM="Calcidiscus leptoporus, Strain RCC1130" /LENGTH=173 /DNA_ID=CAMNT_0007380783 /DNA_START=233 /DNA_END=755 /DNA_ORIENTATION=-